jgi:hypothetical protein
MKKLIAIIGVTAMLLGSIGSALAAPANAPIAGVAVLLCSKWNGYCDRIKPTWNQFLVQTHDAGYRVDTNIVICEHYPATCRAYDVSQYPSIRFISSDNRRLEYHGPIDAASLSKSMIQFLTNP